MPFRHRLCAAVVIGAAGAVSACAGGIEPEVTDLPVTLPVTCGEGYECSGTLEVHFLERISECAYGQIREGDPGFDRPADNETYLELDGAVHSEFSSNPDGLLLDELTYLNDEGEEVLAQYVTNCREPGDGRVFWTKNVADGRSFELYQTWIIPKETDAVVIEGQIVDLGAVSSTG